MVACAVFFIYPDYAIFAKTIAGDNVTKKQKIYREQQEAVRTNVERAFGVLVSQWGILQYPLRLMKKEEMAILVKACVIMHNMVVEARRNTYDSGMSSLVESEDTFVQAVRKEDITFEEAATMPSMAGGVFYSWAERVASRRNEVKSLYAHTSLKMDLIEHLW